MTSRLVPTVLTVSAQGAQPDQPYILLNGRIDENAGYPHHQHYRIQRSHDGKRGQQVTRSEARRICVRSANVIG